MDNSHVQYGIGEPSEQAAARALRAQVQAWMEARRDRRSVTDAGVPVVRVRRGRRSGCIMAD
jgi:hypothetical protein